MAALALGGNRITTGKADLITMVTEDKSPYARRCAAYALGMLGDRDALPALQKVTGDADPLVAKNAKAAITILNATAKPATRG